MSALNELAPEIGLAPACAALRINRSRIYRQDTRRRLLISPRQHTPRPRAPLALSAPERQGLLDVLYCERFADCAPPTVYARLLDEGVYLASVRTMYRLLAGQGQSRERRNQRVHPAYVKPELLAVQPNQVWGSPQLNTPARSARQSSSNALPRLPTARVARVATRCSYSLAHCPVATTRPPERTEALTVSCAIAQPGARVPAIGNRRLIKNHPNLPRNHLTTFTIGLRLPPPIPVARHSHASTDSRIPITPCHAHGLVQLGVGPTPELAGFVICAQNGVGQLIVRRRGLRSAAFGCILSLIASCARYTVSELDRLKEQLIYLRLWLGIMVVTDISLVGWLASAADTATPTLLGFAVVGIVVISLGIFLIHRQIERRIEEIGRL